MSQAAKSHALARVRWREQAARVLNRYLGHCEHAWAHPGPGGGCVSCDSQRCDIGSGAHFDVHAARELGRSMVAMAAEQDYFEDWTRDRGKGPESRELWAFKSHTGAHRQQPRYGHCADARGGWPGNLAREYADAMVKCENEPCVGRVRVIVNRRHEVSSDLGRTYRHEVTWARCVCFDTRKRYTQAPMGRSIARVGQRLLDMLDGNAEDKPGCPWAPSAPVQPSECQAQCGLASNGVYVREVNWTWRRCPDCKGTGHNLRGFVPEVEWVPSTVIKVADCIQSRNRPNPPAWTELAYDDHDDLATLVDAVPTDDAGHSRTRVVSRGEHRSVRSYFTPLTRDMWPDALANLDERVTARAESSVYRDDRLPRWRRGELRHERQRRERSRRSSDPRDIVAAFEVGTFASITDRVRAVPDVGHVEVVSNRTGELVDGVPPRSVLVTFTGDADASEVETAAYEVATMSTLVVVRHVA